MIKRTIFSMAILIATISTTSAGTITNGVWTPSNCGKEPAVPVVDSRDVDAFNLSVKVINEWQQKANAYNGCLVNEANADNNIIANTANQAQAKFREAIEKIKAETTAAKAKLDKK